MKKKLLVLLLSLCCLFGVVSLTACEDFLSDFAESPSEFPPPQMSSSDFHEYEFLNSDDTHHWYECRCGEIGEKIPHAYTIANHDDTYHWNECSCEAKDEKIAHVYGEWAFEGDEHWKADCACGATYTKEKHTYPRDFTFHWGDCVCGATLEKAEHTYDGEACSVCGMLTESVGLELALSSDETYYIVQGKGSVTGTGIRIPAEYNGLPVKEIANKAFHYQRDLKEILIPDSVTSIGDSAFDNCSKLTSIIIPDSVTSIGRLAFSNCSGLTSVTLGDKVISIGPAAFISCSSLTSITIPNSVTSIGQQAFDRCSSLTSITISDSVTSIDELAFAQCSSLTKVNYAGTIDDWAMIRFGDSNANPLYYANHLYINDVEITEVVLTTATKINPYAFYNCGSLMSVTIGNNVTSIEHEAFYDCNNLTNVTIPDSVTYIESSAFTGCSRLIQVENGVSYVDKWAIDCDASATTVILPEDTKGIAKSTFYGCNNLTSITLPCVGSRQNNSLHLGYIFGDSSYIPTSLKTVTITGGTTISNFAFSGCENLTSITIPDSVTSIGSSAFSGCDNLTKVNYIGTVNQWAMIDFKHYSANPLYYTSHLYINDVEITEVVLTTATKINAYAFSGCENLTSITIPNSVTSIGDSAFQDCSNLTKVNYTGTLDDWAMIEFDSENANPVYYTNHLYINDIEVTKVVLATATKINPYAFRYCSNLTSITIPDGVTSIGNGAFSGCENLTSITIPDSVTSIGSAFINCPIQKATIPTMAINNIPKGNLTEVIITGGERIGDHAFIHCISLTSVIIGDGVTSIGERAFFSCQNLTSVTIGNSVTSIGGWAFDGCSSLTKVNYTGTVDEWAIIDFGSSHANPVYYTNHLYINDIEVTKVVLATATKINAYAFYSCNSLTSITIPDSVTSIGDYAFERCSKLTSITIGNGVTSIGERAFWYCDSLTKMNYTGTIDDWAMIEFVGTVANPLYYTRHLYINDVEITEVVLTTATKINAYAFSGCENLTSITIPDSATSIGEYAFHYCYNLTNATFENPNGWTANNTAISSTDLQNTATAAEHLTNTYYHDTWTRADE